MSRKELASSVLYGAAQPNSGVEPFERRSPELRGRVKTYTFLTLAETTVLDLGENLTGDELPVCFTDP